MKRKTKIVALLFIPLLLLSACDDGGFSLANKGEYNPGQTTSNPNNEGDNTVIQGGSSGSQGGGEHGDEIGNNDDVSTDVLPPSDDVEIGTIDLGVQILTFKSSFIKLDEQSFVNVTFENDPFLEKYNFSYYTVNGIKLTNCEFRIKEEVEGADTYKLFIGSTASGVYVIKFYNKEAQQYGRADVTIKVKEKTIYRSYFSVAFNLVQIRTLSFVYSIQERFNKFINFLKEMFVTDYIEF